MKTELLLRPRESLHLWKFWMWEVVLTLLLLVLGVGGLMLTPELVTVVRERQVEVQLLAVFSVTVVTVLAYRLATGALIGVLKWFVRLLGSGLTVACVTVVPVLALRPILKPEYVDFSSPFVALFVLWCFYSLIFLIRWQTRLFYRLLD
jgi:hypothetical protein